MALHCPATVHLVGLDDLPGVVESLRDERVAAVHVDDEPDLRAAAEAAATALGAPLHVVTGLGDPGPRHHALLAIADQYRGEHVLVVVPGHHQLVTMEIGDDGVRRLG